jgi:hypothetical protein
MMSGPVMAHMGGNCVHACVDPGAKRYHRRKTEKDRMKPKPHPD